MYKLEIENEKNILLKNKNINQNNESYILKIIKNNLKKIVNLKYIIIIILIIYFYVTFNTEYFQFKNKQNEGDIVYKSKSKNYYLEEKAINKFNFYIKICNKDKLINKKSFPLIKNPKISVIMPIYNGGKYLNYSLSSIHNQKIKEIEIILIDDFSSDNSIIIIEKYMNKDSRIRLIKNKKNRKILYSKSIAAMNSNGKYIIQLDQDDMFIREDAFNILYFEAKTHRLDLVQMRDFVKKEFFFKKKTSINSKNLHFIHPKKTHYKSQLELKEKLFTENNNYLLWGLLIKTDLYKKALYNLWPLIMNYNIIFNEDYIITTMISKLARKYKYINKFILIHLMHSKSISNNFYENIEFYLSFYFFIYYLYFYIKNSPQDIKIIINYICLDLPSFSKGINLFPTLFGNIIKIILNNNYLSFKEKKNLLKKLNIKINKYKLINTYEYLMSRKEFQELINFEKSIRNENKIIEFENVLIKKKYNISIIIYCLEFKFLNITIISILKQINLNIEIIIIYDNYNKIDLNYINNLIGKYGNIKIINNKENKGIIYSYSIGVLNSNGEYILLLESGYTLSKETILILLYNFANSNDLDLLEFNLLLNKHEKIRNNSLSLYKCSHFESSKDFKKIKINQKYKDLDQDKELLLNKLIKTKIYKKAILEYKLYKCNKTVFNYYEDIVLFVLKKYKLKFRHIDEYGVIQNKNNFYLKIFIFNKGFYIL